MQAVINSFLLILASEMGDITQRLALVLAARFRKPWVVMSGILVATLLNHALASWSGGWIASLVSPQILSWLLAGFFFVFGAWILIPDKDEDLKESGRFGAFGTTVIAFFLAEMGDKTQLATMALGAKYANPLLVTLGSTAGMLVADGMVVFFGEKVTERISMKWIRISAALLFAAFGIAILLV